MLSVGSPRAGGNRSDVVAVARGLRAHVGCAAYGDPRWLADALGYAPGASVRSHLGAGVLEYDWRLDLRARGSWIYATVADLVCPSAARALADELILPSADSGIPLQNLLGLQQHALVSDLERIWIARRGSGVHRAEDLAPASRR